MKHFITAICLVLVGAVLVFSKSVKLNYFTSTPETSQKIKIDPGKLKKIIASRRPASMAVKSNKTQDVCIHQRKEFRCVVFTKNYDADTVTVNIPGVHPLIGDNISVRVIGVDTPEIKGKGPCEKEAARTAKKLVNNMLKNAKRINLTNVQKDKYFRILAEVEFDGKKLSEILIKNKLAYPYNGGTKQNVNWCNFGK